MPRGRLPRIIGAFALGLAVAAGGAAILRGFDLKAQESEAPGLSGALPSPGEPRRIEIPSLSVSAPVLPVGVGEDGSMEAPPGESETGWYARGPRPGALGSAVIAGHLDTRLSPRAVFYGLDKLRPGDLVEVADSEGQKHSFRVTGKRLYPKDADTREVFFSDGAARLNLVTCGGEWDPGLRSYSHRLVVFTEKM